MVELCQLMIVLKSNRPVFSNSGECETTNQTTLRLLVFSVREASVCVTSNGTGFQIHDTTRNDDTHVCCVFGLLDKFVQRFDTPTHRSGRDCCPNHNNCPSTLLYPVISAFVSGLSKVRPAKSMLMHSRLIVDLVCVTLM